MSKEFACRWPTGTETLSVGPGYKACAGAPSVRVGLATGSVVLSAHLHADDVVAVAQALAVQRREIVPECQVAQRVYPCTFFRDITVRVEADDVDGGVEITAGRGLAYLSRDQARNLAMDLLAMTA